MSEYKIPTFLFAIDLGVIISMALIVWKASAMITSVEHNIATLTQQVSAGILPDAQLRVTLVEQSIIDIDSHLERIEKKMDSHHEDHH